MTAREIKAAFDKQRVERRLYGNEMALMLLGVIPEYFEEHPEWLSKACRASVICELQTLLLLRCRDNQSLLAVLYRNSDDLQRLFRDSMSKSPLAGASVVSAATSAMNRFLHGKVIRELDQSICEFKGLSSDDEQALFRAHRASPRVIEWLARDELTFRRVLERSPHLLLVGWTAS
jgi:hypothetical protein